MNLISTAYWGSTDYYRQMLGEQGVINADERYERKKHLNRCNIVGANGVMTLTVPTKRVHGNVPVRDIRIDNDIAWQHQHWISLLSAYKTSPFFDFIADDIAPFYNRHHEFLLDLNEEIRLWTIRAIGFNNRKQITDTPCHEQKQYYQVFAERHGFKIGMSIIDLICNTGPEALYYLT
ncbi:MAG TPA: hypothetical protein DEO38_05700 [Bacteroidales bacterium]|nr:hypothetical protein [Bacteroidales bacterium]